MPVWDGVGAAHVTRGPRRVKPVGQSQPPPDEPPESELDDDELDTELESLLDGEMTSYEPPLSSQPWPLPELLGWRRVVVRRSSRRCLPLAMCVLLV